MERTLGSDDRLADDRFAALAELARRLADQLDLAGPDASAKLSASYLSALKDVRRVTEQRRQPVPERDQPNTPLGNLRRRLPKPDDPARVIDMPRRRRPRTLRDA